MKSPAKRAPGSPQAHVAPAKSIAIEIPFVVPYSV
jgi:hypothetical protein